MVEGQPVTAAAAGPPLAAAAAAAAATYSSTSLNRGGWQTVLTSGDLLTLRRYRFPGWHFLRY
jgi:hypothetical protein